jgi:putative addiction module killer protein
LIDLIEYLDDRKRSPFAEWRNALDPATRARIEIALARIRSGNLSAIKGVGSGLMEMRLQFGPGYRIYMAREGDTCILLLGGGTKRRQQDDIAAAGLRLREHRKGKRQNDGHNTESL